MTISAILPEPTGLQFQEWAGIVSEQLVAYGVPQPIPDWIEWARVLLNVPELVAENLPDPEGFSSWQDWAYYLINSAR